MLISKLPKYFVLFGKRLFSLRLAFPYLIQRISKKMLTFPSVSQKLIKRDRGIRVWGMDNPSNINMHRGANILSSIVFHFPSLWYYVMHLSCKRASLYVQGAEMTSSSSSSETQCIICGKTDDNLYNCKDEASWKTLYLAAKTRGHKKIMALSIDENHFPESFIKYHRDCRASFTHRKA